MNRVREFHEKFGLARRDTPGIPAPESAALRGSLIAEEYAEVVEALDNISPSSNPCTNLMDETNLRALVALAKELADLIVVVEGTAVTFGIPLDKVYAIVCDSNMSKLGKDGKPNLREDGKVLKGLYYRPAEPAIRELLQHQMCGTDACCGEC